MRKFLLTCFAVTLLYGNCSFGMDRDEGDRESSADHSSQDLFDGDLLKPSCNKKKTVILEIKS